MSVVRDFGGVTWIGTCIVVLIGAFNSQADAEDWPMLGRDSTRNAVSLEANPPLDWNIGKFDRRTGQFNVSSRYNVLWAAKLGSMTVGDPVVADGMVWVGTNNYNSSRDRETEDASVLACFRVSDGALLYRFVSPRLPQGRVHDWPTSSMACSPLIEGDRLWFVTNRCETICLDIGPLKRGEGEPKIVWKLDMIGELGVFPRGSLMAISRLCSVAGYGNRLYVTTGNGAYDTRPVPAPTAPSLLCLDKSSGEVLWDDHSPGENLLNGQWSSPLVAEIAGRVQAIAAQGDGWVRSFDAFTGDVIWQFDMNSKASRWRIGGGGSRNNILATPVLYEDHIYIGSGQHPADGGEGLGRLCCIDATKTGDISKELAIDLDGNPLAHRRVQAVDLDKGEKAIINPNSGLLWEFIEHDQNADGEIDLEEEFHRTVNSVAIKDGLLLAADFSGFVHCFDARTGKRYWWYDMIAQCHSTPLIAGDVVYVANEDGDVNIFRLSEDPAIAMVDDEPINAERNGSGKVRNMFSSVYASPVFSGGTLYIASRSHLFAIDAGSNHRVATSPALGNWPQWRGPKRDNVSTETGLMKSWPTGGPPLQWRASGIGKGIASVSIADGQVFTVGYVDDSEYALALDQQTGDKIWATRIGESVEESPLMRWLSQRSPTVDTDRVYVVRADSDLVCLRSSDGVELWRKSYLKDFGAGRPLWGHCDFPLVDEGRLVIAPGSPDVGIAALNKLTGEEIWKTRIPGVERTGHAAIVAATFNNVRQYLIYSDDGLFGVQASDGQILWHYDQLRVNFGNSHTPIVRGDRIFHAGYRDGVAALKVVAENSGFNVEELYHQKDLYLDPFHDTLALVDDHIYGFRRSGLMLCYAASTGELRWGPRRRKPLANPAPVDAPRRRQLATQASLTYADGNLYARYSDGTMMLVEADPNEYVENGIFVIPNHEDALGATVPVIAGGRMYLRDDNRLFCYQLRTDEAPAKPPRIVQVTIEKDEILDNQHERGGPRSVFVPTPHDVVEKMLTLASVRKQDTVYDLGSGDGRIVITAAKKFGSRAVGIEIDRELVEISRAKAEQAGVASIATFERRDIYMADVSAADVIVVYLLPRQLEKLLPQLQKLKPGARIVSHQFAIPGIAPDNILEIESLDDGETHKLFLWTAPLKRRGK